jgi:hypothetical protein
VKTGEAESADEPGISLKALSIPMVTLPAAFTGGGWKTIALGPCGVFVDGSDQHGFTLSGSGDGAKDATLRVVGASESALFVEVTDDRWTGPSRSWVKDDHLELWMATASASLPQTCEGVDAGAPDRTPTAVQWGIRIADGATFSAFGSPPPLVGVQVVRRGQVARVKIPFPTAPELGGSLALVYSDGDDGKTQERLIATAPLERGRGETLGDTWTIEPEKARCAVKGKALAVVLPRPQGRDEPVGDLDKDL